MENTPNDLSAKEIIEKEKSEKRAIIFMLASFLSSRLEAFDFSGIDAEEYKKMKATDEEYPGMTTPTDEIVARMQKEGMKVALGKHPESGNVFILPAGSNDIEMDSISPKQLDLNNISDENLKTLIKCVKELALIKG